MQAAKVILITGGGEKLGFQSKANVDFYDTVLNCLFGQAEGILLNGLLFKSSVNWMLL